MTAVVSVEVDVPWRPDESYEARHAIAMELLRVIAERAGVEKTHYYMTSRAERAVSSIMLEGRVTATLEVGE